MKVEAWKCTHCGGVYLTKTEEDRCRRRCLKRLKENRIVKLQQDRAKDNADFIRTHCEDVFYDLPKMIVEFVVEHFSREIQISDWSLAYKPDLDTFHHRPIGEPYCGDRDRRPRFPGWTGKVQGYTDMWANPVKREITGRRDIQSFSDLFDSFGPPAIMGIHTGTGGGGDRFYYDLTIFLQDFPLVAKWHEQYVELSKKRSIYMKELDRLKGLAEQSLIKQDDKMVKLVLNEKALSGYSNQLHKLKTERREEIRKSQDYQDALKPSEDFHYDMAMLSDISGLFEG